MHRSFVVVVTALLFAFAACGGENDGSGPTASASSTPGGQTLSPLEQSLFSVVVQASDVPEGLTAGAPDFATNEELAGTDQEMLQQLIDAGRQLGVDVQFIPTSALTLENPVRGLQSSASVYTTAAGAAQTFRETADEARAIDWLAGYPELEDGQVAEVSQLVGEETLWIRVSGILGCTFIVTPTPDQNGVVPSQACEDTQLFLVDEIVFRAGRTRAYLKVTTLFPPQAPRDSTYVTQIRVLADRVAQRAATTFPG